MNQRISLEQLAKEDSTEVFEAFKALRPGQLTHAAEEAGRWMSGPKVVPELLKLLDHPRPIVREGALMGLSYHRNRSDVEAAFIRAARDDPDPEIRSIAQDYV